MSEVERYKKLKKDEEALRATLATLPREIENRKRELASDREAAMKSDILGAPDAEKKRTSVTARQSEITRLEAALVEGQERARIINNVRNDIRTGAEAEIREVQEHRFAATVHAFCVALRAAHKAESEVMKAIEDSRLAFGEIDAANVLPTWRTFLVRDAGRPDVFKPEFDEFLIQARERGWDK
jgi:uncharacterized protein involved in exopolysaccharide biosynthesis